VSTTVESAHLDEEAKGILRRIVERTAYRQLMAANIRGHGLKYVPEIDEKRQLARDIDASLAAAEPIEMLYTRIGGTELAFAVRDLMERIPYPYSRFELAVCLALVDRTERLVAESYVESRSQEMAGIARSLLELERAGTRRLEEHLAEFCQDPGNRPTAQQFLNRWLAIVIVAFGRPGSPGDQRAVALGLRSRAVGTMVKRFLDELKPFVESLGLSLPKLESLGVELKT
jgi:1,2-phenylacetyl-CoA epoxidase catalytic subunit